jgi:hypothetical protein
MSCTISFTIILVNNLINANITHYKRKYLRLESYPKDQDNILIKDFGLVIIHCYMYRNIEF